MSVITGAYGSTAAGSTAMLPYCPAVTPLIPTTAWAIIPSAGHRRGSDGIAGTSYSAIAKRTASPAERCGSEPTPVAVPGRSSPSRGTPRASVRMRGRGSRVRVNRRRHHCPQSGRSGLGGCSRPAPYSRPGARRRPRRRVGCPCGLARRRHRRWSGDRRGVGRARARRPGRRDGRGVGGLGGRGDRPGHRRASSRSPSPGW